MVIEAFIALTILLSNLVKLLWYKHFLSAKVQKSPGLCPCGCYPVREVCDLPVFLPVVDSLSYRMTPW